MGRDAELVVYMIRREKKSGAIGKTHTWAECWFGMQQHNTLPLVVKVLQEFPPHPWVLIITIAQGLCWLFQAAGSQQPPEQLCGHKTELATWHGEQVS